MAYPFYMKNSETISLILPLPPETPAQSSCLTQIRLDCMLKYCIKIERKVECRDFICMNPAQRKYVIYTYSFVPFESSKFTIFHDAQEVANRSGDRPSMSTLSIFAPCNKNFQVYHEK